MRFLASGRVSSPGDTSEGASTWANLVEPIHLRGAKAFTGRLTRFGSPQGELGYLSGICNRQNFLCSPSHDG